MKNKHYEQLDGLRGIAAISVVLFHFMEMFIPNYSDNFFAHGFLAVDFFFGLSGFVMSYAYDHRFPSISKTSFFKKRLIRLHPLVVVGTLMGVIAYYVDPFSVRGTYALSTIVCGIVASLLVIPFPFMKERFFNLFSFNAPAWSLFWEYVANILYVLILRKLKKEILAFLTIIFGVALFYIAHQSGNIMGGWSGGTFWDGFVRIGFSFSLGMVVYRYHLRIPNKLGFPVLATLLVSTFIIPFNKWNPISEPIVVVFIYPLLLMLGIGMNNSDVGKTIVRFLGNISYPLYMTHYCFIWIFGGYYAKYHPTNEQLGWIIPISILCILCIAYLIGKYVDQPVRRYLSRTQ